MGIVRTPISKLPPALTLSINTLLPGVESGRAVQITLGQIISSTSGIPPISIWVGPGYEYKAGQLAIVDPDIYQALVDHTSTGNFQDDLNAGYWQLALDFSSLTADAEAARDAAVASAAAAATSEANASTSAASAAASEASADASAQAAAASAVLAQQYAAALQGTSSDAFDLDAPVTPWNTTVELNRQWTPGQSLISASAADPANRFFIDVISYDPGTGALSAAFSSAEGAGSHSDWVINVSGEPGEKGDPGTGSPAGVDKAIQIRGADPADFSSLDSILGQSSNLSTDPQGLLFHANNLIQENPLGFVGIDDIPPGLFPQEHGFGLFSNHNITLAAPHFVLGLYEDKEGKYLRMGPNGVLDFVDNDLIIGSWRYENDTDVAFDHLTWTEVGIITLDADAAAPQFIFACLVSASGFSGSTTTLNVRMTRNGTPIPGLAGSEVVSKHIAQNVIQFQNDFGIILNDTDVIRVEIQATQAGTYSTLGSDPETSTTFIIEDTVATGTFDSLIDTPSDKTGAAGMAPIVQPGEALLGYEPVGRLAEVGNWAAGQRKVLLELAATAEVYDWDGVVLGARQSYWLGAAFTVQRTLNAPPDMTPLTALRQQSGEIHGETGAGGSLIFGAGWSFDESGAPVIGENIKFSLYYDAISFDGVTQENRIKEIKGWST